MFEIRRITPEDGDEVIDLLTKYFLEEEPMNQSLGITELPLISKQRIRKSIATNVSVMAVDESGKIAGVLINKIKYASEPDVWPKIIANTDKEEYKKVYGLMSRLHDGINLFERFGVDKIFYYHILSVIPKYQGQGLGKMMLEKSEEIARSLNYQVMTVELSSLFSQKIFKKHDFEVVREINYCDYVDAVTGKPLMNVAEPHKKIQLSVKVLQ